MLSNYVNHCTKFFEVANPVCYSHWSTERSSYNTVARARGAVIVHTVRRVAKQAKNHSACGYSRRATCCEVFCWDFAQKLEILIM